MSGVKGMRWAPEKRKRVPKGPFVPFTVECWTCHASILVAKRGNGRERKFCNMTCNNNYKGARDRYRTQMRPGDAVWPYGQSDDPIVAQANALIPRNLPEQIRAEACQELVLRLLEGREADPKEAVAAARSGYQFSARFELSMDIPLGVATQTPLRDLLAAPRNDGQARIEADERRLDMDAA